MRKYTVSPQKAEAAAKIWRRPSFRKRMLAIQKAAGLRNYPV